MWLACNVFIPGCIPGTKTNLESTVKQYSHDLDPSLLASPPFDSWSLVLSAQSKLGIANGDWGFSMTLDPAVALALIWFGVKYRGSDIFSVNRNAMSILASQCYHNLVTFSDSENACSCSYWLDSNIMMLTWLTSVTWNDSFIQSLISSKWWINQYHNIINIDA